MWHEINSNLIHEYAIINWDIVEIGTGNKIFPYVCIGFEPEHRRESTEGKIIIGNNNIFREYSSVHAPTKISKLTKIENDCYFMTSSHVAHDCIIETGVTFSNHVTLAGHTIVMKYTNIGMNAISHQYQVIGSYCMIGMGSVITRKKEIKPGTKWAGNPVKMLGLNNVGLERNGVSDKDISLEEKRFFELKKELE